MKKIKIVILATICCIVSSCGKEIDLKVPEDNQYKTLDMEFSETKDFISVSAGTDNTLAIKNDGSLWAWGSNNGENCFDDAKYPLKIMEDVTFALTQNGVSAVIKKDCSLWVWGRIYALDELSQFHIQDTPLYLMDNVKLVAMCLDYFAVLKTDGSLWIHKNSDLGTLFPSKKNGGNMEISPVKVMEDVIDISCLGKVYALKSNGDLWRIQECDQAKLTNEKFTIEKLAVDKIADHVIEIDGTMAIKNDHTLWQWNEESVDQPSFAKVMDDVIFVSNGLNHTMAIQSDGSLWGWGDNSCGQLGNGRGGTKFDDIKPTSYKDGEYLKDNEKGTPLVWQDKDAQFYSVLKEKESQYSSTPEKIMNDVYYVSCGNEFTMAIKTDGSLWAWGMNYDKKLGIKDKMSDNIFGYQKIPARVHEIDIDG